jgi:hypothetical protein
MRTVAAALQEATRPTKAGIARWLRLIASSDTDIEIRAPKAKLATGDALTNVVHRFPPDEIMDAASKAYDLSGKAPGVYFVLNGVSPALRVASARKEDIPRRRFLLIDCDPDRPANSSSTNAEKSQALRLAETIRTALDSAGWPAPIFADSGNGYHLIYPIDLPNDEESTRLIKTILAVLATRHDLEQAKVDRRVFDAPRMIKVYGTQAMKGESNEQRPHRYSCVFEAPDPLSRVSRAQLEALAAEGLAKMAKRANATGHTPSRTGRSRPAILRLHQTTNSPGHDVGRGEAPAIAYLKGFRPAISGQNGHDTTFAAACNVGPGFDLDAETAYRLMLEHYNPGCEPPWSEADLRHKIEDAYATERQRGWLLDNDDERPEVVITPDEHRVGDEAIEALAKDPNVYQRANQLVTVINIGSFTNTVGRADGSPTTVGIHIARLRSMLAERVRWSQIKQGKNGEVKTHAHPPRWAVEDVASRQEWAHIRRLAAIVETPTILPDGSVLDIPGYHAESRLLYLPNREFPRIPSAPSRENALDAAGRLLDLVEDFPFLKLPKENGDGDDLGVSHMVAWLAALITPFARFAINGPAPLFLFDANVPGAGKNLLVDIIGTAVTGRSIARTTYTDSDEEMRKRITSIALAGDRLMLLDNIASAMGGSAFDSMLTATTWRDRVLGKSEMTTDIPLVTTWFGTGNNVAFKGDAARRVLRCRLESSEERPEEKTGFTNPDLIKTVEDERGQIVADVLTILRAYFVAGQPNQLPPIGSYQDWSRVVRSAIFWTTEFDPWRVQRSSRATDPEAIRRTALVQGWRELPNGMIGGHTAAEALRILDTTSGHYHTLRDTLLEISSNKNLPSARQVGMRLHTLAGRNVGGFQFTSVATNGTQIWRVMKVPKHSSPEAGDQGDQGD